MTMRGMIRRISRQGLFGFVESDYPDFEEHFFHVSELWEVPFSENLIGMRMEFESHDSPKGKVASDVRPIEPGQQ
jgi:cold shock CspA family protein